jgi:RNA polymerase sigma-32 factor
VTLEELGRELGVSKERVRQLEARAMGKLKAALERLAGDERDVFAVS